jgi:xanthine/uracil/vitamin C permease (AzgA family)
MRPRQIGQSKHYLKESKRGEFRDIFQTALAGFIGAVFGLLMGMTVLAAFLGSRAASEAGEPGMLIIKVLVVGTFVILSVILFTCKFGGEDKDR